MVGREREIQWWVEMQWWVEKGNAMVGRERECNGGQRKGNAMVDREREIQWWVEKGNCNGG